MTPAALSILRKDTKLHYTLGVVYEPDAVDTQGDFAKAETIRKACWEFNRRLYASGTLNKTASDILKAVAVALTKGGTIQLDLTAVVTELTKWAEGGGRLGVQHEDWDASIGTIHESYCTVTDQVIGGQAIKAGTWLMGIEWAPDRFAKIESGDLTGLSLGGSGLRIPRPVAEPAQQALAA